MVCDMLKNPCVHSTRPSVHVQNVPVCVGTKRTCVSTCARGAGIHGDVLNVHTVTCGVDTRVEGREREGSSSASFFHRKNKCFWTCLEHLNRTWFTKSNNWIFHILRKGRAQSLNTPLLPVAMYSSYETGTLFRLFVQRPSRHFSLAFSSSFYFAMTTQQRAPNQQRRATHDMTRHHTTKKTKTHTYKHMYMYLYVYVYMPVFMYMSVSLIAHFS